MDEHEWLAEQFEAYRTHLRATAYRMLGSLSEAEDAVQESWLHLSRSERSTIKNVGAWLTTTVARICLDMLRSRKSRREEPLERVQEGLKRRFALMSSSALLSHLSKRRPKRSSQLSECRSKRWLQKPLEAEQSELASLAF